MFFVVVEALSRAKNVERIESSWVVDSGMIFICGCWRGLCGSNLRS